MPDAQKTVESRHHNPLALSEQLDEFRARLATARDREASRIILKDLGIFLDSLPTAVASKGVQLFLSTGKDAATRLDITIGVNGDLEDASSIRVFLIDYLGRIDPLAAGTNAAQILAHYTTADEWAVSLRNYAWANPGSSAEGYLQAKALQLIENAAWAKQPSTGFLEAFDTIVYAHGTALLPKLTALVLDQTNPAVAHAAYLTIDRLTITAPAIMLKQLVEQPELMDGREQTRANLLARADLSEPEQRALVEQYLLDPRREPAELATFAGLYPNANFMISNNLLTKVETPNRGQLAAHDREALKVIEQWQSDPRFERLQPLLAQIHERLGTFVRQAAVGAP